MIRRIIQRKRILQKTTKMYKLMNLTLMMNLEVQKMNLIKCFSNRFRDKYLESLIMKMHTNRRRRY
jgi:hypothetical protein